MLQDDLKEIVRLARMAPPSDYTIKIAKIAEGILENPVKVEPESYYTYAQVKDWIITTEPEPPAVKLEKVEYNPPEPEPLDLESIRIRLQTGEKVELPAKSEMIHDLLEKTDQDIEEELLGDGVAYDPTIPLEVVMGDDDGLDADSLGSGEVAPYREPPIVDGKPMIVPLGKPDPRDV